MTLYLQLTNVYTYVDTLVVVMQAEIKRWGNSAAIRLPSRVLAQAKLDVNSPIRIQVKGDKIIIEAATPTKRKVKLPFTEADLLRGLDPNTSHADSLASPNLREMGE